MRETGRTQHGLALRLIVFCACLLPLLLAQCSRFSRPALQVPTPPVVVNGEKLPERWILVDTTARTLAVMREAEVVTVFSEIALGTGGAGVKHRRGDQITPVGEFKVTAIYPSDRFGLFISLDYPTVDYGERARGDGLISERDLRRIREAHLTGKMPPQNTALGGSIGIHGIGRANPDLHRLLNWTSGCLALTNEQMYNLRSMIEVGMLVKIR